jgi:hypothetical protein
MVHTDRPSYAFATGDMRCQYGQAGDLLWVRETWGEFVRRPGVPVYRADDPNALGASNPWRPSIHMPRKYSRLTLKITEVRVERLHQITSQDAEAEGVQCDHSSWSFVDHYASSGKNINGPDSWPRNDWVWVIAFSVENRNVDDVLRDAKVAA